MVWGSCLTLALLTLPPRCHLCLSGQPEEHPAAPDFQPVAWPEFNTPQRGAGGEAPLDVKLIGAGLLGDASKEENIPENAFRNPKAKLRTTVRFRTTRVEGQPSSKLSTRCLLV